MLASAEPIIMAANDDIVNIATTGMTAGVALGAMGMVMRGMRNTGQKQCKRRRRAR